MNFTQDWTTWNEERWKTHVLPRLHEHPIRFLEVGSFEGRSACWWLEHALTDPRDRLVCVDIFNGGYESRFDANLRRAGAGDRLVKMKGPSEKRLRQLTHQSFDGIYVDGSHYTADVLRDAVLCFDLVKIGGFILFDDYGHEPSPYERPGEAIDAFMFAYRHNLGVVFRDAWQVMIRRTS